MNWLSLSELFCGVNHGRHVCPPGDTQRLRQLHWHELLWVQQGEITFRIDNRAYHGRPGTVFLTKPGQTDSADWDRYESTFVAYFHFNFRSIPDHWPQPAKWPAVQQMPENDIVRPLFEYVIGQIPPEGFQQVPWALERTIETLLTAYLCGPLECAADPLRRFPAPVKRVIDWMKAFLTTTPERQASLEDLAIIGGVSRKHLCRLFREHLRCTPVELLYMFRVCRSLGRLKGGQKVESVARQLGFSSPAHFTRRFVAVFGKTPGKMAKALEGGYEPKIPWLATL